MHGKKATSKAEPSISAARRFTMLQLCMLQTLGNGNRKSRVIDEFWVKADTDKIKAFVQKYKI